MLTPREDVEAGIDSLAQVNDSRPTGSSRSSRGGPTQGLEGGERADGA